MPEPDDVLVEVRAASVTTGRRGTALRTGVRNSTSPTFPDASCRERSSARDRMRRNSRSGTRRSAPALQPAGAAARSRSRPAFLSKNRLPSRMSMPPRLLSPDIRRWSRSTATSRKGCRSSSMPPQAASAPSRFGTANPAARRSTLRRAPATRNSSDRWAPTRSSITKPRISATRFRISTSSTMRSAATFTCAAKRAQTRRPAGLRRPVSDSPRREDIRVSTPPVAYERAAMSASRRRSRKARRARGSTKRSLRTAPSKPIV